MMFWRVLCVLEELSDVDANEDETERSNTNENNQGASTRNWQQTLFINFDRK